MQEVQRWAPITRFARVWLGEWLQGIIRWHRSTASLFSQQVSQAGTGIANSISTDAIAAANRQKDQVNASKLT
jgi:hypothetical protein